MNQWFILFTSEDGYDGYERIEQMEKKAEKKYTLGYHIMLGAFPVAYSIGVALRLYVPLLHDNESYIHGFFWMIFYIVVSHATLHYMHSINNNVIVIIYPYLIFIGCCEGVSCAAFCSYFTCMSPYSYSVGAATGILLSLIIIYFHFPNINPLLFISTLPGDILYGIFYGISIAWIINPILFPDGATDIVGTMGLHCFGISIVFAILVCMLITCIVRHYTSRNIKNFESEREQVLKDQDLYDEKCAKARAENKAKAEQERARKERERRERESEERARKEQTERERRNNQQYRSNNRSSSSSGGSRNTTSNSYFKGCSNKTELKRRYRQLCKKLHPDCPGGSAESFRRMKSEYEGLYNKMAG